MPAQGPRLPKTVTVTTHAMLLKRAAPASGANTGGYIGAVNGWNPSQNLSVQDVFQFGSTENPLTTFDNYSYGLPYEKVPGNIGNQTVQVNRYDLYGDLFEHAFATKSDVILDTLTNQAEPMEIQEFWKQPTDDAEAEQYYNIIYRGVWVSNVAKSYSATDQRLVNVQCTFEYILKQYQDPTT